MVLNLVGRCVQHSRSYEIRDKKNVVMVCVLMPREYHKFHKIALKKVTIIKKKKKVCLKSIKDRKRFYDEWNEWATFEKIKKKQ